MGGFKEKQTLLLGKTEGGRRRGQPRMRCLDGITDSMDLSLSKLCEMVRMGSLVQQSTRSQGVRPRT